MIGGNSLITTYRRTGTTQRDYSSTPTLTAVPCYIERADATAVAMMGDASVFDTFTLIADGEHDMREGDRVTDDHGNTFTVRGVQPFFYNVDVPNTTEAFIVRVNA